MFRCVVEKYYNKKLRKGCYEFPRSQTGYLEGVFGSTESILNYLYKLPSGGQCKVGKYTEEKQKATK